MSAQGFAGHMTALETGELEKRGLPIRKVHRVLWMTFEHEAFHVEVGLLPEP
jgi:hypothetical protein